LSIAEVPATWGGTLDFQVENVLAAIGAAWHLQVPVDHMQQVLRNFHCDPPQLPGRFNRLPVADGVVVVDDCHNPSALQAVVEGLDRAHPGRRTAIYSVGRRRR
ncbi:MAG: cyanophycin synthetase, partial [Planctomycetaceae bacterium]